MFKISLRKIKTFTIKNAKFSGYYFYLNMNIWWDFQICISVPLNWFDFLLESIKKKIAHREKQLNVIRRSVSTSQTFLRRL